MISKSGGRYKRFQNIIESQEKSLNFVWNSGKSYGILG